MNILHAVVEEGMKSKRMRRDDIFEVSLTIWAHAPANISSVTQNYSWRMQQSFQPHDDFRADIRAVSRPMQIFVGEDDELFLPHAFRQVFDAQRTDIPVTILPGLGHSDMAMNPEAIHAVVAAIPRQ